MKFAPEKILTIWVRAGENCIQPTNFWQGVLFYPNTVYYTKTIESEGQILFISSCTDTLDKIFYAIF